ncbi:hypothetical protein J7T55_014905 [Diaporthe amygdali]|uniref:uncharacterized protein n=1 Tax=Phomopsis amygdali TaxID=1214568 RepID=UPI0022FF42F2|nr:uncharacterized protein J7T55_014905 [Diaporthe amygdali]KAJ0110102.1 hypothetical protein J7T55_014905 [Diaporthe amygdali]
MKPGGSISCQMGRFWLQARDTGQCHLSASGDGARAGWPSLPALKPGERSRDRVRLTTVGRSTASERRHLLNSWPTKLLGTAVYGGRTVPAIDDVGVKMHRARRICDHGNGLLEAEQFYHLFEEIDEVDQVILVRRTRPKMLISSL